MVETDESKRPPGGPKAAPEAGVAGPPLPAGLWIVATPIGHAADITLRAIDTLTRAEIIACEDTRRTRKLMEMHGIALNRRRVVSYNDRNGAARRPEILDHLAAGRSVAYASDAGTPLVADPGYRLVEAARAAGHAIHAIPGPSAVLAALVLSGLPTDRFLFAGFLPAKSAARRRDLAELATVRATLVVFEAPRRLAACLSDMTDVLGADRSVAVIREMTKIHEETVTGSLGDLAARYAGIDPPRGEAVVVVGPPARRSEPAAEDLDDALSDALSGHSVRDAAQMVAERLGLPRRTVYARAIELTRSR